MHILNRPDTAATFLMDPVDRNDITGPIQLGSVIYDIDSNFYHYDGSSRVLFNGQDGAN